MDSKHDRIGLLALAALIVVGLIAISRWAIDATEMKSDVGVLLGGVVTGLIAFGKDIVAAVRGFSMSAQLGRVTDQLAGSAPSNDNGPVPKTAADGAAQAAEGAGAVADDLRERTA